MKSAVFGLLARFLRLTSSRYGSKSPVFIDFYLPFRPPGHVECAQTAIKCIAKVDHQLAIDIVRLGLSGSSFGVIAVYHPNIANPICQSTTMKKQDVFTQGGWP